MKLNLRLLKKQTSPSWRSVVFVAVGMLGVFHEAQSAFLITTIAGDGTPGYSGDDGPAINAQINGPTCIIGRHPDNLYCSDWYNNVIRRIDLTTTDNTITTISGVGIHPGGYVDKTGKLLYINDYGNHVIYKVNSHNTITLIAGTLDDEGKGVAGYEDGPGLEAKFYHPVMPIVDGDNLYLADF